VSEHKAAAAARKQALITSLKGKQDVYSDAELEAMSADELDKVSRLVKVEVPNFAGRAVPRADAAHEPETVPAAPSLGAAIKAAQGK
jgi:hypothetical protein